MMKTKGIIALATMVVLASFSTAHAGKRLTTSSSAGSDGVECTVVNVSDTKTITVDVNVRAQFAGAVVASFAGVVLAPKGGTTLLNGGPGRWCEFVVVSGGSTKDLRANMVVFDSGAVAGIEAARDK